MEQALDGLGDGATVMAGGFGLVGIPENLIAGAASERGTRDLTVISNNCGVDDWGLGLLLRSRPDPQDGRLLRRREQEFERRFLSGELEVELVPQGTLAERIRAGGAGIPALLRAGRRRHAGGRGQGDPAPSAARSTCWRRPSRPTSRLVKAWRGDTSGNLVYRRTARNFNPMMAAAARGHHRRGGGAGGAGPARPRPGPHAGHLRAADRRVPALREAGRAAHRPRRREGLTCR